MARKVTEDFFSTPATTVVEESFFSDEPVKKKDGGKELKSSSEAPLSFRRRGELPKEVKQSGGSANITKPVEIAPYKFENKPVQDNIASGQMQQKKQVDEATAKDNLDYLKNDRPKEVQAKATEIKETPKSNEPAFDGIDFMKQDIIEHGGGKSLKELPSDLESLNLYFDNDANNAASYFKDRTSEIDKEIKDLLTSKQNSLKPSEGDIGTGLNKPQVNPMTGKFDEQPVDETDTRIRELKEYKNKLYQAQSTLAKQYAGWLGNGKDVTTKGKIYERVMGDEAAAEKQRLEDKGIPITQEEKYKTDMSGLAVSVQELNDEYNGKDKDDEYYSRLANLELMEKGILNKYPEYKRQQGANLIAQLAVKDKNLKILASTGSGELSKDMKTYLEQTYGVKPNDLKGIDYGDIPSESFLGNVGKEITNAATGIVTGVTRMGGILVGADEDRLTYLNQKVNSLGKSVFGENPYEQLQESPTLVNKDLQTISNPRAGKYNYNAATIKNAIGSGIGGLVGFIGGVKGAGKVLSLSDDAAMTSYLIGSGFEPNYQKANEVMGKDASEFSKGLYATGMGYLEALAFKVLPKDKIFFGSAETKAAQKELAKTLSGMTINSINKDAIEGGFKKVLKSVVGTAEETAKIGGALTIAEMAKTATNVLLGEDEDTGKHIDEGVKNIEHLVRDLPFSMGIPLGLMEIPKYRSHSNRYKETIFDAGNNPDTHISTIRQAEEKGLLTKEEADKKIEVVEVMSNIVKSLPMINPKTSEPLTHQQQVEYAYNRVKEIAAKTKADEVKDAALAPFYKKEALELVDERTAILTGEHEAYNEMASIHQRAKEKGTLNTALDAGTKTQGVQFLQEQALTTPASTKRSLKGDEDLTIDLIARNEPQSIKEELKSLKADHKKLIEQEKKAEANEVQKNIDLLEAGLEKQGEVKAEKSVVVDKGEISGESVPLKEPTPTESVEQPTVSETEGKSDVVVDEGVVDKTDAEKVNQLTKEHGEPESPQNEKERKKIFSNTLLDTDGNFDAAFHKAGYKLKEGIWLHPDGIAEKAFDNLSPETKKVLAKHGVKYILGISKEQAVDEGMTGHASSHNYDGKTAIGMYLYEGGENWAGADHVALHELGHSIFEGLPQETQDLFHDNNPTTNHGNKVKNGDYEGHYQHDTLHKNGNKLIVGEEDFAELFAENKGDLDKTIAAKKEQSLSKQESGVKPEIKNEETKTNIPNTETKDSITDKGTTEAGKEAGGGKEPPKGEDVGGEEGGKKGITHAAVAELRKLVELPEYEGKPVETHEQLISEAETAIKENPDVVSKVLQKMENDGEITNKDNAIMAVYKATVDASLARNPTKGLLDTARRIAKALDVSGTKLGKALESRKLIGNEDSLTNFLLSKEASQGTALSENQIKNESAKYEELKAAKEALEKQLETEREQHAKDIAELGLNQAKAKAKREAKKSDADYKAERKDAVEAAREALKKLREQGLKSTVPLVQELAAIAPHLKKVFNSLASQGIDKLDNVITQVHAEFKDVLEGLTKKNVLDIVSGQFDEKKKGETRNEKAANIRLLNREIQLLKELEQARKGEEKAKTEKDKVNSNRRIDELKEKIKEVRRINKNREVDTESPEEATAGEIEYNAKLQKQLTEKAQKLTKDIKEKKYLKEEAPPPVFRKNRKTQALEDKVIDLENKIRHERSLDEYNKRGKLRKAFDKVMEVLGIRRIVQSAVDMSVPFRQGATLLSPRRISSWVKGFQANLKSVGSQKNFERIQYQIRHDQQYNEMVKDGIKYNDMSSADPNLHNEDFRKSFIYSIPIVREPLLASNRSADAFLNVVRYDMYKGMRANLEKKGYTRESDPEAFQKMANHVMNMTGSGKKHSAFDKPAMNAILGNTFYGANLMASRLNLLNPVTYFDPRVPKAVRYEAMKDMVAFTGTMVTVATALAYTTGAKVSLNPDDSDFLQLRYDDKVYDISGGLANYVRTGLRIMKAGYTKATGTKHEGQKATDNAGKSILNFFRNKLSPNTGYAVDAFFGGRYGNKFDPTDIARIYPMYSEDYAKALKEDGGLNATLTVLLPNILGVGYGSYASKGQIDKNLEDLQQRNMRSDEMDNEKIHNYKDGGRVITFKEFNEFADKRDFEIEKDIKLLYEKGIGGTPYKELTQEQVAKEITFIKANATRQVKEDMFGKNKKTKAEKKESKKLSKEHERYKNN